MKIIFLILAVTIFHFESKCQFDFGAKAGLNFANVTNQSDHYFEHKIKTRIYAGLFINVNFNISLFDTVNRLDIISRHQKANELIYETLMKQLPQAKLDSVSSNIFLVGLNFKKFNVNVSIDGKLIVTMVTLRTLYNRYNFAISYTYRTENTKLEIENMLSQSKLISY